jgi:hypothetical protein
LKFYPSKQLLFKTILKTLELDLVHGIKLIIIPSADFAAKEWMQNFSTGEGSIVRPILGFSEPAT